jgi:hypothetical protein
MSLNSHPLKALYVQLHLVKIPHIPFRDVNQLRELILVDFCGEKLTKTFIQVSCRTREEELELKKSQLIRTILSFMSLKDKSL